MSTKKDYIKMIRYSTLTSSFNYYYFIRVIVLFLLAKNVTPWVAVSVPIVLEFATLTSRSFTKVTEYAIKVNYKVYHIFYTVMFICLGLIIASCRNIYTIYLFTILLGLIKGIKNSSLTKLNTQNKEYEPFCFIEEERSSVIGGTLGLIISQFVYDLSPRIYFFSFFILLIIETIFCFSLKEIPNEDIMEAMDKNKEIPQNEKNNIILATSLFAILAGLWCIGLGALTEITPLITKKVGYIEASYTILESILLFVISGKLLEKLKHKKKLLLSETIVALVDVIALLIASITLSWQGLLVAYLLSAVTSTLGDPIWGSIMSAYSCGDRSKWILVNKVYFIERGIFQVFTWLICRKCVIRGITSFKYLAVSLIVLLLITYVIANKINKKVFKDYI